MSLSTMVNVINVREIEIKTCLLSFNKAVEHRLTVHKDPSSTRVHFRLLTVRFVCPALQLFPYEPRN